MKQFDLIQTTPNDRGRRAHGTVDLDSLKRRTRKRVQLEYRKLRAEPLHKLLLKLTAFYGAVLLVVILCNKAVAIVSNSEPGPLSPLPRKLSVIVPTYHEVENIPNLCGRVFQATRAANIEAELILVDDNSNDGSLEAVLGLQADYDVTMVVRKRAKGLSSAVLAGFAQAKHDIMLVMDADLSHPPEALPSLVQPVFDGQADFALGSRHVAGGGTQDWPFVRKVISWGAAILAWPLTEAHDPMSGFFAVSKRLYQKGQAQLNPLGFKIALEILVKCEPESFVEVPYVFVDRAAGTSKLKLKTQVQYLHQIVLLYWHVYQWTCVFLVALTCALGYMLAVARGHQRPMDIMTCC